MSEVGILLAFCFCDEDNNENQFTTRDRRVYGSLRRYVRPSANDGDVRQRSGDRADLRKTRKGLR